MILIKNMNVYLNGELYSYELENGALLSEDNWNQECFETESGDYYPIFSNEDEQGRYRLIGFELNKQAGE